MSRELKIEAARAALEVVEENMRLGIGTGSTANEFIRLLGEKVANGFQIIGVPTSERTRRLCEELSIPITTLEEMPELDLVVDGADEVDPHLNLVKGAGGALLREKIVAHAANDMIVIVDQSKVVEQLGAFPLPIEIDRFGSAATCRAIDHAINGLGLSAALEIREGDRAPYLTDGGHLIVDASFGHIRDATALAEELNSIPGVVEHGLFLGYASLAFVADRDGVGRITR